jgi:hypothetical protein
MLAFILPFIGIRLLDGPLTDIMEASALGFNSKYVHIYSASWGPDDNGENMDGPGYLTRKALHVGAEKVGHKSRESKQRMYSIYFAG